MILSITGVASIVAAIVMSAFPAGVSSERQSIEDMVDAGVSAVSARQENDEPSMELPTFREFATPSIKDRLNALGGMVAGAQAADATGEPSMIVHVDTGMQALSREDRYAIAKRVHDNPVWMGTNVDINLGKWIYVGKWVACEHIRADYSYNTLDTDPALSAWLALTNIEQTQAVEACNR